MTLGIRRRPTVRVGFRSTYRTFEDLLGAIDGSHAVKLKYRLDATLIATSAYAMEFFGWLSVALQRIGKRWSVWGQLFEFIAILLSIPCIKVSHFFFKIAYSVQIRHLSRIRREHALRGGHDFGMHFPERIPKFSKIADLHQFLYCLTCRIEGRHDRV